MPVSVDRHASRASARGRRRSPSWRKVPYPPDQARRMRPQRFKIACNEAQHQSGNLATVERRAFPVRRRQALCLAACAVSVGKRLLRTRKADVECEGVRDLIFERDLRRLPAIPADAVSRLVGAPRNTIVIAIVGISPFQNFFVRHAAKCGPAEQRRRQSRASVDAFVERRSLERVFQFGQEASCCLRTSVPAPRWSAVPARKRDRSNRRRGRSARRLRQGLHIRRRVSRRRAPSPRAWQLAHERDVKSGPNPSEPLVEDGDGIQLRSNSALPAAASRGSAWSMCGNEIAKTSDARASQIRIEDVIRR